MRSLLPLRCGESSIQSAALDGCLARGSCIHWQSTFSAGNLGATVLFTMLFASRWLGPAGCLQVGHSVQAFQRATLFCGGDIMQQASPSLGAPEEVHVHRHLLHFVGVQTADANGYDERRHSHPRDGDQRRTECRWNRGPATLLWCLWREVSGRHRWPFLRESSINTYLAGKLARDP